MFLQYSEKKIKRKQARCRELVSKDSGIAFSHEPTLFVAICNAGLNTGITDESILQEAIKYGNVSNLTMVPNKSYCFLSFGNVEEAVHIFQGMHGRSKIGQNGSVIYMSYFESVPEVEPIFLNELPPGALLLKEFITMDEEKNLLNLVSYPSGTLKNRCVKHFGYEFLYGSNIVDLEKPLETGIPKSCEFLWQRLREKEPTLGWHEPDQLTVNYYTPGHGIPPHVDTHSAFCDPILSLSVESDILMDFRKNGKRLSAVLPRRSLLIMSGESRYDWTHGITPRLMDVVRTPSNTLTTQTRGRRISFTFRKVNRGPCRCSFPALCDSQHMNVKISSIDEIAMKLEDLNVHSVYDNIATHFSQTRHTPWPNVAEFVRSFPEGSIIVDVGCGNGKYMAINRGVLQIGCDRSQCLLNICQTVEKQNVLKCDCLAMPFRSSFADGVICIAVIHHLASEDRRLKSIKEMVRILNHNGTGLIYVWAKNQKADCKLSNYLQQNKAVSRGNISEAEQRRIVQAEKPQSKLLTQLPIHANRTEFLDQDVLVPWKLKDPRKKHESSTFLRYYHVFEDGELEELCRRIPCIEIEKSFYDQGNHCLVFKKK